MAGNGGLRVGSRAGWSLGLSRFLASVTVACDGGQPGRWRSVEASRGDEVIEAHGRQARRAAGVVSGGWERRACWVRRARPGEAATGVVGGC
jgi:hypothetical protein